jgi:cysteine desulfurase/selenocysteine lyase
MIKNIKKHFPVFEKNPGLIFLDTAASAQKPTTVIESVNNCYSYEYANIHRGVYKLSTNLTNKFENVRIKTSKYINAESEDNIVFTKSATEAINLVASCFSEKYLNSGDEILLSYLEHHANIVPWQIAAKKKGFKIVIININKEGTIDYDDLISKINNNTKFISITHMSNVIGSIVDIQKIKDCTKKLNIPLLIDGCQYIAHAPVDVKELECDFYVYSGHKLYGPTGVGILYMKNNWFDQFDPYQGGGSMINNVDFNKTTFAEGYQKFEAGTPPIAEVIGLGASYDFISQFDLKEIFNYEKELYEYAVDKLKSFNDIQIIGHSKEKGAILSFNFDKIHSADIGMILDQHNIAIRTGHHCAQPLLKKLNLNATARASFGIYNTMSDVDNFIYAIKETKAFFNN